FEAGPSCRPTGAGQRDCRRNLDELQGHCSTGQSFTRGKMVNAPEHKSVCHLTAFDRRTITKSLKDLRSIDGEHGALLYESTEALPVLFKTDRPEAARARQANSQ